MTLEELFDKILPPDIAQEAKENTPSIRLREEVSSPKLALLKSFPWKPTKQGGEYWNDIHHKYFNNENLKKLKTGNSVAEQK